MKKIIGIIIVTLLIATAIPVYGTLDISNRTENKPLILPGNHKKYMSYDGEIRSYIINIPPSYDGTNPVPVVFNLHGYPGHAIGQVVASELNIKSNEAGFIAVYPNGHIDIQYIINIMEIFGVIQSLINGYRYWNAWDFINAGVDDVGFFRALIEELQTILNVDSSRIYISGFSGGGFMSYRLGAELSDIVAAICTDAGSIGGRWRVDFSIDLSDVPVYVIPEPENPIPVIVFHGMKDSVVPYEGKGEHDFKSVNESVAFWVEHNECDPIPDVEISESGNIITRTYENESQGTEVVLYSVVDGDHIWFGSDFYGPCEISVNDLMWEFFEAHPKQ